MAPDQVAEIAVFVPVKKTFHYKIPAAFSKTIGIGQRVSVPFGPRTALGIVVGLPSEADIAKLKPIAALLDREPIIAERLIALARWMATYYQASLGETLQTMLPAPLRRGRSGMTPRIPMEVPEVEASKELKLTPAQQDALNTILGASQQKRYEGFLLHGVTSSGKTEVYLQALEAVLAKGQGGIVLVPEIALTPQTTERFFARFGADRVAVLHSGLKDSDRYQEWKRVLEGKAQVVVGARSALFAPLKEIGLIVVDEEHESSYKQEEAPRYHARDVALELGRIHNAAVVLGSATPSLEAYAASEEGALTRLTLPERIDAVPMPSVEVVDMRRDHGQGHSSRVFSHVLEKALEIALDKGEQIMLFLNRRGFATFLTCQACGAVVQCPSCQITLTYHMKQKSLSCHTCGHKTSAPDTCPECNSSRLKYRGMGTERVESELARLFPEARVGRMDTDSTAKRGTHAKILKDFSNHKLDVLIGTQMIAKGHDFPKVTLVGVISADTALNLPDFRAAERTFQLMTQVAGRAGRRKLKGKVIVQTYAPHHYAIQSAQQHDYSAFVQQELAIRSDLALPPFTKLVQITIRSMKADQALDASEQVATQLHAILPENIELLGPAPASIHYFRRHYRWQILLKSNVADADKVDLSKILSVIKVSKGVRLTIDVDPF